MRRVLGTVDLTLIAVASIGPAFSLATTLGPMVESGGSATPLALGLIALIMTGLAFGYRRLGMHYPNAGSSYAWVQTAFGTTAGAYAGWILIVANVFAIVATAVPAGAYTMALLAPATPPSAAADALVGTMWVLAAGALLLVGLRPTASVANTLVVVELIVLGATAVAAFARPAVAGAVAAAPPPTDAALVGALAIGVWMLDGWEISATTAEEAATPPSGPGLGGLGGLGLSAAIIGLATAAFLRVGTPTGFAAHEGDALAYVGAGLGGRAWGFVVGVTVLVSLAAALQTTLVYLTRSFYAMGRGGVLPPGLGSLDPRAQPARAIVLLTLLGMASTLASALSGGVRAAFAFILNGASVFLGVLFVLSAAASVRLFLGRRSARLDGVVLPGLAAVALAGVLAAAVLRADPGTRLFLLAAAAAGLPAALWRGRAAARRV